MTIERLEILPQACLRTMETFDDEGERSKHGGEDSRINPSGYADFHWALYHTLPRGAWKVVWKGFYVPRLERTALRFVLQGGGNTRFL